MYYKNISKILLIIVTFIGCVSHNTNEENLRLSESYSKKAVELVSRSSDSIEYAISLIDSALIYNPSDVLYVTKIQFNMYLNKLDSAICIASRFWDENDESYSMSITTGLLYDINNNKDSANYYYNKAIVALANNRKDHSDIYYKLDMKYLEILLYGGVDCAELLDVAQNHKDSLLLRDYINYLDTLSVDVIKNEFTKLY